MARVQITVSDDPRCLGAENRSDVDRFADFLQRHLERTLWDLDPGSITVIVREQPQCRRVTTSGFDADVVRDVVDEAADLWRSRAHSRDKRARAAPKHRIARDPRVSPVPKAMRIIRRHHEEGRTWEAAARLFKRNHPEMAFDVMDRVGTYPSSDPELRALQKVW